MIRAFIFVAVGLTWTGCAVHRTSSKAGAETPPASKNVRTPDDAPSHGELTTVEKQGAVEKERSPPKSPPDDPLHPSHIGEHPNEGWPNFFPPHPPPPVGPKTDEAGWVVNLEDYTETLKELKEAARQKELEKLGAVLDGREGFFLDSQNNDDAEMDRTYEVKGKRFAVLGYGEPYRNNAAVGLARVGDTLHRIEDRPHHYPVTVKVRGVAPCPQGRGAMAHSKPISIPLNPGEKVGPPVFLHYEMWSPHVVYEKHRICPPPPPSARGR